MVDLGVAFAGEDLPGVDLIMPDLGFIEKAKKNLVGIVITHAHEDHIGALAELWPSLGAPVYMTRFAAGLAEARRLGEPGAPKIPLRIVAQGEKVAIGPFVVEFIAVAHSIPESSALAIRTPAGLVVHTADWKIDPTPIIGPPTDEARLKALGDEGVLALVCDSTNVLREGESPSERDVAKTLAWLIGEAKGRVVVTTFASNVARLRAAAEAGFAAGRQVCILGRAMERVVAVARECGMLDGVPPFLGMDAFDRLPRDKILALATGSQGEPRAALARMAEDEHPTAEFSAGDTVIFSSRTIPGNEKAVGKIINAFVTAGVEVVTDRTALVHVSGHPRRAEMAKMYAWVRPKIAVPAHGEPLHLSEHAAFAKAQGVPQVLRAFNGDLIRLAPGDVSADGQGRERAAAEGRRDSLAGGSGMRRPAPQARLRRRRFDRARADPEGRDGRRPGRDDRGLARAHARRGGDRRADRRCDLRGLRGSAAGQAARPRRRLQRHRARGAQRRQRRLGQEAAGACAGGRSVARGRVARDAFDLGNPDERPGGKDRVRHRRGVRDSDSALPAPSRRRA